MTTIPLLLGPSTTLQVIPVQILTSICLLIKFPVFDKVVTTALKYTPMVLDHHIPYRALNDGR